MSGRHERDATTGVVQALGTGCADEDGTVHRVDATLAYDPSDPYAVTLTFRTAAGDVPWCFARELLVHGLVCPVGDGDVHVWPTLAPEGRSVVVVELTSPDGHLRAETCAEEICHFLGSTLRLVPLGEEHRHLDLDLLLARLLRT